MENNILNGENSENLNQENSSFFDEKVSSSNSNEENIPQLNFDKKNKQSWEIIQFSKLFSFLSNNTLSRNELTEDGNIKNIHYGDILVKYGDCVDVSNEKIPYIKSDIKLSDNIKFLNNGDVIIADTAEDTTVGKAIEVYNVHNNKIVSGLHTFACRPNFKFANKYLGYYLNSSAYHNQLLSIMQGIKVLSISKSNIGNTQIMFPKEEYQQKIADFLSLVDKRINKQRQLVENLKKYKRGLLVNIIDNLSEIKEKSIGASFSVQGGYAFKGELFQKTGIPIIRISNINDNNVDLTDLIFYDSNIHIDLKFIIKNGDILIAMSGATTGKIGKYNNEKIAYLNQRVGKFTQKNNDADMGYLYQLLSSEYFTKGLKNLLVAGAQPNISPSDIESIILPFPDLKYQEKISNLFSKIDVLINKQNAIFIKLLSIKQGLLQQMFI